MLSRQDLIDMKPLSADSHIVEPPNCYTDRIDSKYRDRSPKMVEDDVKGATFVIDGVSPVHVGGVASAGATAEDGLGKRSWDDVHKGAWDSKSRIAAMDRDGVFGEVIFPSAGMAIYAAPDLEYGSACMKAYNGWLAEEYISAVPDRLWGVGQTNALSPADLIEDLHAIKAQGFVGAMMPAFARTEEGYHEKIWDSAWEAAAELSIPLCFHVLPHHAKGDAVFTSKSRGTKLNNYMNVIRFNQDLVADFIFGGVFERHPKLKMICVEGDAGWVAHAGYRMDHAYERFGRVLESARLSKKPTDYIRDNVFFTFQDDLIAFQQGHLLNTGNLMWASDFPHNDSTWPNSMDVVAEQSNGLDRAVVKRIVHDNTKEVFGLNVA